VPGIHRTISGFLKSENTAVVDTEKRAKALAAIDPRAGHGIEIGALNDPLVTPQMGSIVYVDHKLTPDLRAKYAEDPAVEVEDIVDVDFQLGEASLAETIGTHRQFDYVVASHVIEHIPDVVTWLQEIAAVLKPGGILSLVIPDKRFTFDYLRPPSTASEMIEAHLLHPRSPTFRQVFDYLGSAVKVDVVEAWVAKLRPDHLEHIHTEDIAWENAQRASVEYIDVHCWVFTPQSFFDAVRMLIRRDLFDYRVTSFFPTARNDLQFFVALERIAPDLDRSKREYLQEGSIPLPEGAAFGLELAAAEEHQNDHEPGDGNAAADLRAAREQLVETERENSALQQRIKELLASRSWRFTAPFRWMSSRFHHG
jgi:SAM-dependent methyltransferase